MFTNNYIAYKRGRFFYTSPYVVDFEGVERQFIITQYEVSHYLHDMGDYMKVARCQELVSTVTNNSQYTGVYFGTGPTAPTKEDYRLESPITTGLNIINPDGIVSEENGNGQYVFSTTFLVENTTENEMNIWEVGLFGQAVTYASSSRTNYPVLFDRQVFTEPVNLQPGERKLVTYKITFNQTLNVD